MVPTSKSCSDSRRIIFETARTCTSAEALQQDALVMATLTEPDTQLIPSWLVVEIEVLKEDQVMGLFPPVRT